jgi:hypothetical protein
VPTRNAAASTQHVKRNDRTAPAADARNRDRRRHETTTALTGRNSRAATSNVVVGDADWDLKALRTKTARGSVARLAARSGPTLTSRDLEMLAWIARHGVVTADQLATRFFGRDSGSVGYGAAYRRLRKLRGLGLLRSDRTFYQEPSVLRVTAHGAHLADAGVGPARLVLAEVRHTLALVDLLEGLLAKYPGSTATTERELRVERRIALARGERRPLTGRMPDGVLVLKGKRIGLELDLTSKRSNDLERIVAAYQSEQYDAVWWYVRPRVVPRLTGIVNRRQADDLVIVRALPRPRGCNEEGR